MSTIRLVIFLLTISFSAFGNSSFDYKYFSQIPILANGRIKPLDTFARVNLLMTNQKSKLKDMKAIEWLAKLIFDPENAYNIKVFKILNKDVVNTLGLELTKDMHYTPMEVANALQKENKIIEQISKIEKNERSPAQQQTYEVYFKLANILEISRSLSLLVPQFIVPVEKYAKKLNLPFNKSLSYIQLNKRKSDYKELVKEIFSRKTKDYSNDEIALFQLGSALEKIAQDSDTQIFRIVPPQFDKSLEQAWHSPWQTVQRGFGNPLTAKYFNLWAKLYTAYHSKDLDHWEEASKETLLYSHELSKGLANLKKVSWEVKYSKYDLFTKSIAFYILAFLILCASWIVWRKKLEVIALGTLCFGAVLHIFGLVLRCYIMSRPPVTTLYESIVFVSIICVASAVLLEFRSRNNMGTFIGSCLGIILLFVSFSYEKDGDSMGMLAAVLDTNFWLATHVVTITIGYGCCFVASILAHVYLFQRILKKMGKSAEQFEEKLVLKNMHGAVLFSLFFTVLGTILGGIWADQSWGRFWGWDPKENGAMLICMWLLWAVHGKLTKYFDDLTYATSVGLTSIVVVLAWFGVNLLNVGLHSYGFTTSIAMNIALFTAGELLVCFGAFAYLKRGLKQ